MRFLAVLVILLLAAPAMADDAAEANKLMIEAVQLMEWAERAPSAEEKLEHLQRAHDKLTEIIERYPSTDLAVKLATGQRVGNISLTRVRKALEEARAQGTARTPGAPVRVWQHGERVLGVALSANGRRAWATGADGVTAIGDIRTGEVLRRWQHAGGASAVALSADGRRMLTMGSDRSATWREVWNGRVLGQWQLEGAASTAALSPDGGRALVGLWSTAYLIDLGGGQVLNSWEFGAPVTSVAYSPDTRRVFMGSADGGARLGDARTGATLHRWKHPGSAGGGVMSAAFSPDGRRMLAGDAGGTAVLRDVETGKTIREWDVGYSERVRAVAFSPDGRWVLTADDGREIALHDAGSGRTLRTWRGELVPTALAFSVKGHQVLMGFQDGTVILCDLVLPRSGERTRTALSRSGGCW